MSPGTIFSNNCLRGKWPDLVALQNDQGKRLCCTIVVNTFLMMCYLFEILQGLTWEAGCPYNVILNLENTAKMHSVLMQVFGKKRFRPDKNLWLLQWFQKGRDQLIIKTVNWHHTSQCREVRHLLLKEQLWQHLQQLWTKLS